MTEKQESEFFAISKLIKTLSLKKKIGQEKGKSEDSRYFSTIYLLLVEERKEKTNQTKSANLCQLFWAPFEKKNTLTLKPTVMMMLNKFNFFQRNFQFFVFFWH